MSNSHSWCHDVQRDVAIRAAEDAAAVPSIQHRDLPKQVALLWASVRDIIGSVVRIEGEIDAGEVEAVEATIGSGDVFADVVCGSTDDEVVRLTDERNTARAEAERLRIRVAELEAATAAGGVSQQEPVAWGVIRSDCGTWMMSGKAGSVSVAREIAVHAMRAMRFDPDDFRKRDAVIAAIGPLLKRCLDSVAAPSWPLGWLTAEEADAVDHAADIIEDMEDDDGSSLKKKADALRALLARSSPPRVRRPQRSVDYPHQRDAEWIAVIRAAGVEVEG